jgi:hypothetical protein
VVIEHTFVTTWEARQAMQAAMQFLASRGFQRAEQSAFPMNPEWNTLEMRRGRKRAAHAKNIAELPQTAHVQWDRGRVTVALSIEPSHAWGGSQVSFGLNVGSASGKPKQMVLHAQMLSAIATGLEQLLAYGASPELAAEPWSAADEEARRLGKRRKRRHIIVLVVVFGLLALLIGLIVVNA